MYYLLDTFGRAKSPTRLSARWRRLVRQLSDTPPRARSTVEFNSIRTYVVDGHMYYLLDTFGRAKSPTRLSCRWSRLVRQLSDTAPRARSIVEFNSIRTYVVDGHMYYLLDTFGRAKSPTRLSARWSRLVRQLSDTPPRARSTVEFNSIRTYVVDGHMYYLLDTFGRAKSPTRLSCRWRRLVRQLSDTPPRARSIVEFHSITTEMCTRTHVLPARHLRPGAIADSTKCQVEPTCTTTL